VLVPDRRSDGKFCKCLYFLAIHHGGQNSWNEAIIVTVSLCRPIQDAFTLPCKIYPVFQLELQRFDILLVLPSTLYFNIAMLHAVLAKCFILKLN